MEIPAQKPEMVYCSKCGMTNPSKNKFCYNCGGSLYSVTCSFCSNLNPHYAKFCGNCGRKLASEN